MRILHISTRLILGGSQENTLLSCEGQARRGHEVHLAYGPIFGPEGSMLDRVRAFNQRARDGLETRTDAGSVGPIVTHEIPTLLREVRPAADLACRRALRSLIDRLRPDIVHTHSSKAGILGRLAAWDIAPPQRPGIVHTIHGPPFMPIEGSPAKRLRRRLTNLAYTLAERRAARRCHLIISVADAMTRDFLRRRIGRPDQYLTIRSGIETTPFLRPATGEDRASVRAALGLTADDFVVGTVARLAEHKGHDDLLDALGPLMRDSPRLKLLWVGDGWWRDRLLAKARAMGLRVHENRNSPGLLPPPPHPSQEDSQIIVTGLVPPDAVPAHLRAMDVLAHPSYREGLPRTVPQALLCGVCPVAYDVDGTGEVCKDMHTGRLVPPGDLPRLRDAILWCMHHPAERDALAATGRAECADAFSAERMVAELESAYARATRAAR